MTKMKAAEIVVLAALSLFTAAKSIIKLIDYIMKLTAEISTKQLKFT